MTLRQHYYTNCNDFNQDITMISTLLQYFCNFLATELDEIATFFLKKYENLLYLNTIIQSYKPKISIHNPIIKYLEIQKRYHDRYNIVLQSIQNLHQNKRQSRIHKLTTKVAYTN